MALRILPFESGPVSTIGYLLVDSTTKNALLVDCPMGSGFSITSWIHRNDARLTGIVITHGHWDHIGDAAQVSADWKVPVWIHPLDRPLLEDPMTHFSYLPFSVEGVHNGQELRDGQTLDCGSSTLIAHHAPGHTPGHLLLLEPDEEVLFSGDVLFRGSIGRTDFPGGNMDQLLSSIQTRILPLPGQTRVYPGHGPSTTVEEERQQNPFLVNLSVQ